MTIYKILPKQLWLEAMRTGSFNGSPVDVADGFIHFSTASQVNETAKKHFAGVPRPLGESACNRNGGWSC